MVMSVAERPVRSDDVSELRARLRGELLGPGDAGYEPARALWNGAIDTHPGAIARCQGSADVLAAVRYARDAGLLVAVRGGGHNVAGTASCDHGLVLDLSPMKGAQVDPAGRTVWAQPGLLWGELDHETHAFGLATTGGIVTHTGIAGLTLGGGIGWLMRKHGLTSDNLLAVDLVTADGQLVRASAREHPELFWGIRGGGGNFGVVTAFQYRLHEVGPTVLAGSILFPADDGGELLRFYRDFAEAAPDELATVLNLRYAPPLPIIPEYLHGVPVVSVVVCWAGPIEEGLRVLEPLRRHGRPLLDLIAPKPYLAHQGTFDATVPHGLHYYWRSEYLGALDDQAIGTLVEREPLAPLVHDHLPPRRRRRARPRRGGRLHRPHRRLRGERQRRRAPRGRRGAGCLGPRPRPGAASAVRRRLHELPGRRGPGPRPRRLRTGQVPAPG